MHARERGRRVLGGVAGSGISILSCTGSGEWIVAQKPQALAVLPTCQEIFLNKCLFIFLYAFRTHSKGGCGKQSAPAPVCTPDDQEGAFLCCQEEGGSADITDLGLGVPKMEPEIDQRGWGSGQACDPRTPEAEGGGENTQGWPRESETN